MTQNMLEEIIMMVNLQNVTHFLLTSTDLVITQERTKEELMYIRMKL